MSEQDLSFETPFEPSRAAARARLAAFVPRAGAQYAKLRNFDLGPGQHDHVSCLSPYLRLRLLDEVEVTRSVLEQHSADAADKFLAEVFWRTYWKGWLELRPAVWDQYLRDLNRLQNDVQTQAGLRARWEEACLGQTGIAPFDAWAQELVQTGYLHNHARMWFASIWIFTLELPWQLGADFFMRHLLDGDAASNTLGWRWVAGIQTPGKTYLAQPDNIEKFTRGRFADVRGLARSAPPLPAGERPAPRMLPPDMALPDGGRTGVLIHSEDVGLDLLLDRLDAPAAFAYADATADYSPWQMAPMVQAFRDAVAADVLADKDAPPPLRDAQAIADWAADQNLDQIVTLYAPTGPMAAFLDAYEGRADALPLIRLRRPLDSAAWPHATKGFFPFRQHIPDLIAEFCQPATD